LLVRTLTITKSQISTSSYHLVLVDKPTVNTFHNLNSINMNKYILSALLITIVSSISTAQTKYKKILNEINIPFQIINGYFVKNTFTEDHFPNAKISTQKAFDELFGAAAFMGKNGTPTAINFKQQYVIAITDKETDLNTTIAPISLKKITNKILFEYRIITGKQQSYTIKPLTMILVNKKYTGKVETFNSQKTVEFSENKALKMLNNQWIIEHFNNPERIVESKNCYINIDLNAGNFSGSNGCNNINGKLKINGDSISFDNIISTKMACEKMEQSNIFIKNLSDANKYKIIGGELFLYKNELLLMTLESFK
jgi:heat shock protein HslJ